MSAVLIVGLFAAASAQAPPSSGFDAHGFRLAAHDADLRDPLTLTRPGRIVAGSGFVGGVLEYAAQPLVFDRGQGPVTQLDSVVAAHLSTGFAPLDRLRFDVSLPMYLYSEGLDRAPLGAGLGDVRATGMVQLVAPDAELGGVGAALLANVDLPTGRPSAWQGQTGVAGGTALALTYEAKRATVSAQLGTQLRPNTPLDARPAPTRGGDAFTWGVGVGYLGSEELGISLELFGEAATDQDVRGAVGVPVSGLLSMRHLSGDGGFLTVGLGTALTRGAGASPLRMMIGGGFGAPRSTGARDSDGDGIPDALDACPAEPEVFNAFLDADGCPDDAPVLTFRAVDAAGAWRKTAHVVVEGPLSMDGLGSVSFRGAAVQPDGTWEATATLGACLRGTRSYQMGTTGETIDIPLEPVRRSEVELQIVDVAGEPIEGAVVRFRSEDDACSPEIFDDLPGGVGAVAVGAGSHFMFVSADGYAVHQGVVTVEEGASRTVRVTLRPALAQIDASDPERTVIRIAERVYFDVGRATIQARSHALLDEVAAVIRANRLGAVEVGGHTDSTGDAARNLQLSTERADAVRAYLIERGVAPEALVAMGYGEDAPVADNGTAEGRATNRRVEFTVLEEE